jgi:hypothetical protein
MKSTTSLLYLSGFILLFACGRKQADTDRTYEEGVEVVLNHIEPYKISGQPAHLTLEEEIKIDLEKEEYDGLDLKEPDIAEPDSKGNIYIVEQFPDSEYFIYKFGTTGKFVKKFGHKGQGPGEIQGIYALIIDRNDRILISDRSAYKLLEFDTEGNFINETRVQYALREVIPLANGCYLARRTAKDASEGRHWYLCLFNSDFQEVKKIDSFDMSVYAPGKQNPGTIISWHWRVADDRIYVGNEQRGYELWVYDLQGNLLRKIRKEYHPVPYPEEFRQQTEKLAEAQPGLNLVALKDMPPFNSFFPDDEGRLFVMTYEPGLSKNEFVHDIINADGVFIGRVALGKYGILGRSLNHLRAAMKNGRFYRLFFKESGYPELRVYRMVWDN